MHQIVFLILVFLVAQLSLATASPCKVKVATCVDGKFQEVLDALCDNIESGSGNLMEAVYPFTKKGGCHNDKIYMEQLVFLESSISTEADSSIYIIYNDIYGYICGDNYIKRCNPSELIQSIS